MSVELLDYKILDEGSFVSLWLRRRLPKPNYNLKKGVLYYFYYDSRVYGLYRLLGTWDGYHHLRKNHYKSFYCRLPRDPRVLLGDGRRILSLFRQASTPRRILILQLTLSKEQKILFRWCSRRLDSVFGFSQKEWTNDLRVASRSIASLLINKQPPNEAFSLVRHYARRLYEALVGRSLSAALVGVTHLYVENETEIPFNLLFDGSNHLYERFCIHSHKTQSILVRPRGQPKPKQEQQKLSLVMPHGFDDSMEAEFEQLSTFFRRQKAVQLNIYKDNVSDVGLIDLLRESSWVHFIGRGEVKRGQFHFILNPKQDLSVGVLSRKSHPAPKRLVMSACMSDHPSLKRWFFGCGGKTFVGAKGEIMSSEAKTLFSLFYKQVANEGIKLGEAMQSIRTQSTAKRGLGGFQLELSGEGFARFDP